jgi:hypothetical protein
MARALINDRTITSLQNVEERGLVNTAVGSTSWVPEVVTGDSDITVIVIPTGEGYLQCDGVPVNDYSEDGIIFLADHGGGDWSHAAVVAHGVGHLAGLEHTDDTGIMDIHQYQSAYLAGRIGAQSLQGLGR